MKTLVGFFSQIPRRAGWLRPPALRQKKNVAETSGETKIKGYQAFFYCISKGTNAVITSNSALKSSESQLSNAGSTVKIGHFLDDMKPSEIKAPKPEISEILEKVKFCINNFDFSKANQQKLNLIIWNTEAKLKLIRCL